MTRESPDALKDTVREHYGQAIRVSTAAGCCSGAATSREQQLYGAEMLGELPEGLQTPSYGCGNPFLVADLRPGECVLDLGSGAGLDALLAARKVGDDGRVYGLDMTDAMLEIAQQNARKAGARNVVFLRGDLEAIPLPNASVDVIISNCVVNLAPNKHTALAEASRVLRKGGRLAISDIVVDGDLEGFPLDEGQIRAGLSWAGCVAGALTTTELRAILGATGFSSVRIDVLSRYTRERMFRRGVPSDFTSLPDATVDDIIGRFASSMIAAVKL